MSQLPRARAFAACILIFSSGALASAQEADPVKALSSRAAEPGFATAALAAADGAGTIGEAIRILDALSALATGQSAKTLYSALAPMLQLAERWAEAANAWESAARSVPGSTDGASLANAGLCALAAGDAARALSLAKASEGLGAEFDLRAAFIEAFAYYLNGERESSLSRALAVVASGDLRLEPAALLLAAELTSGADRERYVSRLKAKYPSRPEATGEGLGARFAMLSLSQSASVEWKRPEPAPAAVATATEDSATAATETAYYQVGAFRAQANADALIKRLADKGFKGMVSKKKAADGIDVIIVYVEAGAVAGDGQAAMLLRLKDAGFEAWPLSSAP